MESFEEKIQATRQIFIYDPKKRAMIPKDQIEEEEKKAEEQARQNYGKPETQTPTEKQTKHDQLIDPKSLEDAVNKHIKVLITDDIEKSEIKG